MGKIIHYPLLPFCPISWASGHLPESSAASTSPNNEPNINSRKNKGVKSCSHWTVLKEKFLQAVALLWMLKNTARKSHSLRQLHCSSTHQCLSTFQITFNVIYLQNYLKGKGNTVILVLQMESQGIDRALLPNHFSFISELTSGSAWLCLTQRSALWTAALTWRLTKAVELP